MHHVDVALFVALIDVAGSHHAVVDDLDNIIGRLNSADQTFSISYRAQAKSYYYAAYKIKQDAHEKDSAFTTAGWELFMSD